MIDLKEDSLSDNLFENISMNYVYNTIQLVITLLYPILSFPIVARILGPKGVGIVSLPINFINIFLIIANFGLPLLGMREIARKKSNIVELKKTISEIFSINILSTFISISLYLLFIVFFIGLENEYLGLYLIIGINLILNFFQFSYYFQGLEKFKFLAYSTLFTKIVSLVLILVFIKTANDYYIYGLITVIALTGNGLFCLTYIIKNFKFRINFKINHKFLKISFLYFNFAFMNVLFNSNDKIFIGLLLDETKLGLYVVSYNIVFFLSTFSNSLGNILLPKLSNIINIENNPEVKKLINFSINFSFFISLPLMILIYLYSKEIIYLYAGPMFNESVSILIILTPLIFLFGMSHILDLQILFSLKKDKIVFFTGFVGLMLNIILNIILIERFGIIGISWSLLLSVFIMVLLQFYFSLKYYTFNLKWRNLSKIVVGNFILLLLNILIINLYSRFSVNFLLLLVLIFLSLLCYLIFLILLKETVTNTFYLNFRMKIFILYNKIFKDIK